MLERLVADTGVIMYLMAGIGALGILAKIINHSTLRRLVKAAGNMPKSTHRLIKLVRAKYEHACMIHDSVENIDAFVEKYIYEYRGFLFRIHTWRQVEILSVWFAGVLAAMGAAAEYLSFGLTETVYQYVAVGIAEIIFLSVVMRLTDEPYKINAVKMYMIDYLENICAFRLRKQSQREKEFIDVIAAENSAKEAARHESETPELQSRATASDNAQKTAGAAKTAYSFRKEQTRGKGEDAAGNRQSLSQSQTASEDTAPSKPADGLSINIEGEPRAAQKGDAARQAVRSASAETSADEERTALRQEAIRQILEEFLA